MVAGVIMTSSKMPVSEQGSIFDMCVLKKFSVETRQISQIEVDHF